MYKRFLVARDLVRDWKDYKEQMASMSFLLKEARDLNETLEGEVVKL